jgi:anti-anti-sigma factor
VEGSFPQIPLVWLRGKLWLREHCYWTEDS